MAKWEVHWRLTLPEAIWWRWMPGETFDLPWPSTPQSSDPNEIYRPWLEANIGRQGWDWQWRSKIVTTMYSPGYEMEMVNHDIVVIKVRRSKVKMIPWAILALT